MDYVNKFNHLAQYARTHVDIDEKKMDHFNRGLSCNLQEKLYTGGLSDLWCFDEYCYCYGGTST